MNTGQSSSDWRDKHGQTSKEPSSSHLATGLGQSFREQEEEDYDDEQDAAVFEKTTIPPENYNRAADEPAQYYDEEGGSSRHPSQYGQEVAQK